MPPQFEFLMRIAADVGEVVTMGGGPLGERRVVSIDGGTFRTVTVTSSKPDPPSPSFTVTVTVNGPPSSSV